jgi:hypothetical protein
VVAPYYRAPASDLEPNKADEGVEDGSESLFGVDLVVLEGLDGKAGEDLIDLGKAGEQAPTMFGLQSVELDILIGAANQVGLLPQRDRGGVAHLTHLLGTLPPIGSLTLGDHGLRRPWA